jgi:hypothetical protein
MLNFVSSKTAKLPPIHDLDGKPKKIAQIKRLIVFIEKTIEHDPHERGGLKWCACPQPEIAEAIGVSVRTLQTLIKSPPFYSENALIGEGNSRKKLALLRVLVAGEKPRPTPETIACGMRKVFLERYGQGLEASGNIFTPTMHGCLVALAGLWPEGKQMDVFKVVLNNWSDFMSGVGMIIDAKKAAGLDLKAEKKFYRYPSISVIRRFYGVGTELYGMELQAKASTTGLLAMLPPLPNSYFSSGEFFGHLSAAEIIALDDADNVPLSKNMKPVAWGKAMTMKIHD